MDTNKDDNCKKSKKRKQNLSNQSTSIKKKNLDTKGKQNLSDQSTSIKK